MNTKKSFQFYIDTGGTFTDCLAKDSDGKIYRRKVLSSGVLRGEILEWLDEKTCKISTNWQIEKDIFKNFEFQLLNHSSPKIKVESFDVKNKVLRLKEKIYPKPQTLYPQKTNFQLSSQEEAPVLAARLITQTALNQAFPKIDLKLGSTKGTNALLERKGEKTVLFVTKGFKDILIIGNQQRPNIFALNVIKPKPLYSKVVEIKQRLDANGEVIQDLDLTKIQAKITDLVTKGFRSAAVAFINSHKNSKHEKLFKNFLLENGFAQVSTSTEMSESMGFLPRTQSTVVNAYLQPIIQNYLKNIQNTLQPQSFLVMSSSGSLMQVQDFKAKDSLLSGPAGGIIGASVIGKMAGFSKIISFDMGGTSTDVARYDQDFDYQYKIKIGDAEIFSPALAIETVAAGGGSICSFDGFQLCVGPESAGAFPGPACYAAGGPLTITDVHLLLDRLDAAAFNIPINKQASEKKLQEIQNQIEAKTGEKPSKESLLNDFLQIANEIMAEAIKKISIAKGYDLKDFALLAFGGAGGLHACQIANLLEIKTVIVPKDAGLLSAFGIANASVERLASKQILKTFESQQEELPKLIQELKQKAKTKLIAENISENEIEIKSIHLFLRFEGQASSLEIPFSENILADFKSKYQNQYGHWTETKEIELESIRVWARSKSQNFEGKTSQNSKAYQNIKVDKNGFSRISNAFSTSIIEENFVLEKDEDSFFVFSKG